MPVAEPTATEPVVLYQIDEQVGIITLNRPDKLNAISPELQQALTDAFAQFKE
jgi:enoyl-CoA hydratase/carnithine racemase